MLQWNDTKAIRARNRREADELPALVIDPNNPAEMAVFASACILAKHLAYADGEAFFGGWAAWRTPVDVWQAYTPAEKEQWIVRAMTVLKALHGYGPVQPAKVLDFESRGVGGDTHAIQTAGDLGTDTQPCEPALTAVLDIRRTAGSTPAGSHQTCCDPTIHGGEQ